MQWRPIKDVELPGYDGKLNWKQEADGLTIACPENMSFESSIVFKVN